MTLEGDQYGFVCVVANSGSDIPAGKADQIFEHFQCGDATRGVEREHGQGLSIFLELFRDHGGTIELSENRPGNVEFRISLPARGNHLGLVRRIRW